MVKYTDIEIYFVIVSPSVRNNSAVPTKYIENLHIRTNSFIHPCSSITIMQILSQYKTEYLYVAH
jgi:hypothetical protein